MLRIHFTSEDLSKVTVAQGADPLWEVLSSLHLLQENDDTLVFGRWRSRTRKAHPAESRLLLELAPPRGYSADFLTPGRGTADVATLVERMLCTPRQQLRDDLALLTARRRPTPWTRALAHGDTEALRRLGRAVTEYYRCGLAPYSRQMNAQIQADLRRRTTALLTGGVDRLLSELHPRVTWQPPVLCVHDYVDRDLRLEGRGLVLLPSFFCRHHPVTLKNPGLPPVLAYPVSPRPDWLTPLDTSDDAVAALLGRARAAALQACTSASTTTDISRRAGLSPSGASRHATVLRNAGLISSRREGGAVVHEITGLGSALLEGDAAL